MEIHQGRNQGGINLIKEKEFRQIRLLRPNEISCRVQQVTKQKSALILLYKDARTDASILDEHFGPMNWQREHFSIQGNLFCTVSVRESADSEWVKKQDVGTPSDVEKIKGESSDSFKRACFMVGIGKELYSAPVIFIPLREGEYRENNGKFQTSFSFAISVRDIEYNENKEISKLVLVDKSGTVRFTYTEPKAKGYRPPSDEPIKVIEDDDVPVVQTIETPVKVAEPVAQTVEQSLMGRIDARVKKDTRGFGKEQKREYGDTKIKPFTDGVLNYKIIEDVEVLKALYASLHPEEQK